MATRDGAGGRGGGRLRLRHAVVAVLGAAIGAVLVAVVFVAPAWEGGLVLRPRFDLGTFARRLPDHAPWLVPFVLVAACLPALRALAWRAVLPLPTPRLREAYHATALGALVHNTVPGKLGPVAAAWVLARHGARRFTPAFSSQLLAKLLEMGAVVLLGASATAALRPGGGLGRVVAAGAAVFAAFASGAAALALGAPRASARLGRRFPRAGAALASLAEGIAGAGSPRRLGLAVLLAALPALAAAVAYGLPLRALGVERSVEAGAILVAVITFGQLTPGLPVGTGVYWSLAAWAARELGASPSDAAAVAVLTHAGMVLTSIAVGGASALVRRRDLAELFRRRREVERLGGPGAADAEPSPRAPT
jgi:hypothetical protein